VGYRNYYSSYGDPWTTLGSLLVSLVAFLIIVTVWALAQALKHVGRAFTREPTNPLLWTLLIASLGLWGLAAVLSSSSDRAAASVVVGAFAASFTLLLILVSITISLTSEQLLPTLPESLVTTAFKKSWW
jgi:hypothetical protein